MTPSMTRPNESVQVGIASGGQITAEGLRNLFSKLQPERPIAEAETRVLDDLCTLLPLRRLLNHLKDLADLAGGAGNPARFST